MNKVYLILFYLFVSACSASDQKHWERIQSLMCGNRPLITDEQLSQLENKCRLTKEGNHPVSSCSPKKLETDRDLLEAFCDAKIFGCVQNKPLLSDSELMSTEKPEQLKEMLVDCIENVIKYNHYLFDDKINFN